MYNVISHVKYVLYFYISTFPSMRAVFNMAVLCCLRISCFSCMLHRWMSLRNFQLPLLLLVPLFFFSFMQGILTNIPETNHVSREYIVAVILSFFMVPLSLVPSSALLCFYISTFRSMCAVATMVVLCSSLTSWFPGMSLTYFPNYFKMVPVAPITVLPVSPLFLHSTCAVFLL
jgi:hypothetical protein